MRYFAALIGSYFAVALAIATSSTKVVCSGACNLYIQSIKQFLLYCDRINYFFLKKMHMKHEKNVKRENNNKNKTNELKQVTNATKSINEEKFLTSK